MPSSKAEYRLTPAAKRDMAGRHAIYYRVTGYGIAVIRILHERMSARLHL